jgi:archaellum component FlaG (FlaF/FlaG flagellin family)
MMRAGISRVVVEIIILVIAVALALLIFSPISGYIFGSLGRTATVGGAAQIQILNAQYSVSDGTGTLTLYVKNLGPGTIAVSGTTDEFKAYVDGNSCSGCSTGGATTWTRDMTITVTCTYSGFDTTKQHSIVLYGPGNTQTQYLYYPSPS